MQISKIQTVAYNNNLNRRKSANNKPNIQDFEHNTQNYVQIPLSTHQTKLISFGSDISVDDFVIAANRNDVESVKRYIESGGDVNALDTYGRTALYLATCNEHLAVIKELAKCPDLDPNRRTLNNCDEDDSFTPLGVAAYRNNSSTMQELLKLPNIDVNIVSDTDGRSPLLIAYKRRNFDILNLLLDDSRVDVNFIPENKKIKPLIYSIIRNTDNDALYKLLKRDDVDLNIPWDKYEDVISYANVINDSLKIKGGCTDRTESILQMLEEYAKEHPNSSAPRKININQITNDALTAENNIYTSEEITKRFVSLIKSPQQALEMLKTTPLIDVSDDSEVIKYISQNNCDKDVLNAIFKYKYMEQSQMLEDYNQKRAVFLKNMENMPYSELIKSPLVLNTPDGFENLLDKREFNPNDLTDNKSTLFEQACLIDPSGKLAKRILDKYEDVFTKNVKTGSAQIQDLINEYNTFGKYRTKLNNIEYNITKKDQWEMTLQTLKDFVNSEEYKPEYGSSLHNTPMHIACNTSLECTKQIINTSLRKGADIDTRNRADQTPLMIALKALRRTQNDQERTNVLGIIKFILDKGADVNVQDMNGQTPFHYVCMTDSATAMKLLLAKNPNIFIPDKGGRRANIYLKTDEMKELYNQYKDA